MIGVDYFLSPEDNQKASRAALAVNQHKADLGKGFTKWREGSDPYTIRRDSFRAELAVARLLGLDHDWEILDGGDGHIDIRLPQPVVIDDKPRYTIEVKWRSERQRDIATSSTRHWDEIKADLYVLTWPSKTVGGVTVVGYCTKDDFLQRVITRPPVRMTGLRFEMRWQDLRPIEELIDAVAAVPAR